MKSPIGFCLAVLATASLALAGGPNDKKNGGVKRGGTKSGKSDKSKGEKTGKKETSTAKAQDGGEGEWSGHPGDGITYTSKLFRLNIRNGIQVRLNLADNQRELQLLPNAPIGTPAFSAPVNDSVDIDLPRTRTRLSGSIWNDHITYQLEAEWQEDSALKDAWVDWGFYHSENYDIGFRFGQLKTRFGREWSADWGELDFIRRSLATRTFSSVRSRGGYFYGNGDMGDRNDPSQLSWSIAAHGSDPAGGAVNSGEDGDARDPNSTTNPDFNDDDDDEVNWTLDVNWTSNPNSGGLESGLGDLDARDESAVSLGAAYYIGHSRYNPTNVAPIPTTAIELENDSLNVWGEWKTGKGFAFQGEYFMREESPDTGPNAESNGWHVSGSWVQKKSEGHTQFGVGVRYAAIEFDDAQILMRRNVLRGTRGDASELDFVLNMFHSWHALKTQVGVTWQNVDVPGQKQFDNIIVSIQNTFRF